MTITIKDVAKRAGVTHSTVSRALRGSSLISEETTSRVRQAALDLGYQASAAARSLKTRSTHVIGAVVSNIDDPFFGEVLQGIEDTAQSSGYSLFIAASQHDQERQRVIVRALREHRVDGLIICSTSFGPEQHKQFSQSGIPIVVINNQAAEDYKYSIYHDDEYGSAQVTRYLLSLGHTKIAYLGNSLSGRTTLERQAGFQQALRESELAIPEDYLLQVSGASPEQGMVAIHHLLILPDRPTAVVCYNDMLAIGAIRGLQQAGYQVPGDFSVTGFDNITFSAYTNPPLTTFDQPKRYIGSEAARLILGLLKPAGDELLADEPTIRKLKGHLLVRASTGTPGSLTR
jgi:DNA-binding LacI/PurR family transcriptional regulator